MSADPTREMVEAIGPIGTLGGRHGSSTQDYFASAFRSRKGKIGIALIAVVLFLAILGPSIAAYSPSEFVTTPFAKPTVAFPLGGDVLGRDVASRLLCGGWTILLMAFSATLIGVALGVTIGISAAYSRSWVGSFAMRAVDILLAFPQLVFALLLVSIIGPKPWLIVVAIALSHMPQVARVVRGSALDVTERDFVKVSVLYGTPRWKVVATEILPNVLSIVFVEFGIRLTYSILIIATLSFLGFGLQPPDPNWGAMINENRVGITANPWGVAAPAFLVAILTVGVNTFTDAVAGAALGGDGAVTEIELDGAGRFLGVEGK